MKVGSVGIAGIALFLLVFSAQTAFATPCPVPNTISNGQVADATKVMENFSAVADCAAAAIVPTGTPTSGAIAVFSGSGAVSSGDLTGDVTTSGGTVTMLPNTGVVPGPYLNANIVVDAKGRITSASNGIISGGGGGGGGAWTELAIYNPDAEAGNTTGWTQIGGGFTANLANPTGHTITPIQGTYAFVATANANPKMSQTVNLSSYATQIDSGLVSAKLVAFACDTFTSGEYPYLYMEWFNGSNVKIASAFSPTPVQTIGQGAWRSIEITADIPAQTRSMAIYVWANRVGGTNNNVGFDSVRVFVSGI